MLKVKKSGFTLVEVILACSIFAIVVSWIVLAINRSYAFMNNTRLVVRATNFAREWMEMMYNIRDTNWRKNSGWRDNLWLYLGKGEIRPNGTSPDLFAQWIYVLKEETIEDWWIKNKYFYAEPIKNISSNCELYSDSSDKWFWSSNCDSWRNSAKIKFCDLNEEWKCKNNKNNQEYYYYDENDNPATGNFQDVLIWDWLEFYRIVRVFGIFCKDANGTAETTGCSNSSDPKEMRFCVKVFYRWNWQHSSELCGIMTNFME